MDYFFLKIVHFLIYLKKGQSDAKWIAFLYLGIFMTFLVVTVLCMIGLQLDNYASNLIKRSPEISTIAICILLDIILGFRYYHYKSVEEIESSYQAMSEHRRRLVNFLIYVTMLMIPFMSFIILRLYLIGQIKWW